MNKYFIIAKVEKEGSKFKLYEYNTGKLIEEDVIYATKDRAYSRGMVLGKTIAGGSGKVYWRRLAESAIPSDYIVTDTNSASPTSSEPEIKMEAVNGLVTVEMPPAGGNAEDWNFSDEQIRKLIVDSPKLIPKTLVLDDLNWRLAVRGAMRGENLLFLGHSGCGKTLSATTLAKALKRPFFKFNMGAMQDARASLIGNTHYAPDAGTFFAGSEFVKAIQTPGAVILLDEYTRISPDAENIMLTVLDKDQRYLRIDEAPDTPVITVAPGVVFMATANVGTEYTSTRQLDRATKDRFGVIVELPLLSLEQEIKLMKLLFPKLNRNYIDAIASVCEYTRTNIVSENPTLSTIISTRSNHEQCLLALDGFRFSEIMEGAVFNLFDNENGVDSERAELKIKAQEKSHLDAESPLIIDNAQRPANFDKKNLFDKEEDSLQ